MQTEITYSHEIPEIYHICKARFDVDWDKGRGVIFTYGTTIYSREKLSDDLKVHECTHVEQQRKMGAENWWSRYLDDPDFRLSQELEAYQYQYRFLQSVVKDRNKLFRFKHQILKDLSSSMYGNMVSYSEALRLLE